MKFETDGYESTEHRETRSVDIFSSFESYRGQGNSKSMLQRTRNIGDKKCPISIVHYDYRYGKKTDHKSTERTRKSICFFSFRYCRKTISEHKISKRNFRAEGLKLLQLDENTDRLPKLGESVPRKKEKWTTPVTQLSRYHTTISLVIQSVYNFSINSQLRSADYMTVNVWLTACKFIIRNWYTLRLYYLFNWICLSYGSNYVIRAFPFVCTLTCIEYSNYWCRKGRH